MTDAELLNQYRAGNHDAFSELVKRHADWAYSVALRHVSGDRHLAEDVMQAAFIVLARDVRTRHAAPTALNAWLFKVVRFTALTALRGESRRRKHERKAASMTAEAMCQESPESPMMDTNLDDLIARLRESDRQAVLLRYYHRKEFPEIARELGISETAARKRSERAIDKLRQMLKRITGAATLTPFVMIESALRAGIHPAPANAIGALNQTLSSAMPAELGNSAASLLARDVVSGLNTFARLRTIICAAAVLVVGLLIVTTAASGFRPQSRSPNAIAPDVSPIAINPRAHTGPLRVGILVSHFTATKFYGTTKPISHRLTGLAVKALQDPSVELYGVIEPGTATLPDMVQVLGEYFAADHVLDGSDPRAIETLDVITTLASTYMKPEVVHAMHEAVFSGVGYLRIQDLGCETLTPNEEWYSLLGVTRVTCFWRPLRTMCQVVAPNHPLLAGMVPEESIEALPIGGFAGSYGTLRGEPLIAAKDAGNRYTGIPGHLFSPVDLDMQGHTFYPMFVSQLGAGKIVACQWLRVPPAIDQASGGRFYLRCVKWLGGRPLE